MTASTIFLLSIAIACIINSIIFGIIDKLEENKKKHNHDWHKDYDYVSTDYRWEGDFLVEEIVWKKKV